MTNPDVSVCVFARDQGVRLHASMVSITRSIAVANGCGMSVELICILYAPSPITQQWCREYVGHSWRIIHLDDPRLGMARRAAALAATGRYITYVDGDDLWSANWLSESVAAASTARRCAVWRHEAVLQAGMNYFSPVDYKFTFQPDGQDEGDYAHLLGANPFASSFLVPLEVLAAVPFPCEDAEKGWSDVDHWWSCNVAGTGYQHRIVPGTFLYRVASASSSMGTGRIGPTPLSRNTIGHHLNRSSSLPE